ncbi:helix-turn-helix domain-containing protein [Cobetia crustatorum]|uniref:Helix-turn-helix domain-containing protein n=1 Tax=Cobetia crustatorum TaxID=553385 RepID=A0A558HNM3_9GAMM|nr:helix-turn-helix domain-containing protein [Cobetia crustatorum]TVU70668.1 helix-turn-helix domain-containing protein [Cobetia crustatorum]
MQQDSPPSLPSSHPAERTLGERLRALRIRHGLSQRELAKRAHVTNSTISQVEQNAVSPSVSSLNKILDVFPISLSDFFGDEIPEPPTRVLRAAEHSTVEECVAGMTLQRLAAWPTSGHHDMTAPNLSIGSLTANTSVSLQASHDTVLVVTQGGLRIEVPGTGSEPLDTQLWPDDAVRLFAGERYRLHHAPSDDIASGPCRWISMTPVR